jgi:hypothetical protein
LGWDTQNFWILKTLNFLEGGDVYNLKNITRHDYPHLGAFIWAIYTKISFLEYEYLGRIFYIFFYCLAIFSIAEFLNFNDVKKILFSSIIIILTYNISLFNGYQEVLLFSIFTLFSKYFYLIIKKNIPRNFLIFHSILIIILLLISTWIKNEGMFFSSIFVFLMLCLPKKSSLFKLSVFFSYILIIILRFFIYEEIGLDVSTLAQNNYVNLNLLSLESYFMLDRILLIFKYLLFGILSNLIYLISLFMILFMFFCRKVETNLFFYLASLFLNFWLIFCFYIYTTVPLQWHLKVSAERVLFEVLGIYLIPIVIFINVFFKKTPKIL